MGVKKAGTYLLFIGGLAATIVSLTDVYDRAKNWLLPQNLSLQGLELCLYDHCIADNQTFISTIQNAIGRSVEADFILDVPIGNGDYNARCAEIIPYLYAPEELYFLPTDLGACDTKNGVVFGISSDDVIVIDSTTFSHQIRVKGTYVIGVVGPEPRYEFIKE